MPPASFHNTEAVAEIVPAAWVAGIAKLMLVWNVPPGASGPMAGVCTLPSGRVTVRLEAGAVAPPAFARVTEYASELPA